MAEQTDERPLTRKGQATRERILAAATELIAAHGVAGTSNEQVRKRAGVSGSQLSHYFDSKQALIGAVITRQADGGLAQLGVLDSFEALEAWAAAAVERQEDNDCRPDCSLGTLAGELTVGDEPTRAALSDGFLRWKDVLQSGLTQMQQHGDLRRDADPESLAYALLSALQGGALVSQALGQVAPMRSALEAALAYVRTFAA